MIRNFILLSVISLIFSYAISAETEKIEVKKLNFLENFAANVIVKLSETDKGGEFLLKLVRPSTLQEKNFLKINNSGYLDMLFNIQNKDQESNGQISYCGADVVVSYKVFKNQDMIQELDETTLHLGENKFTALENIAIGMHEGETRKAHIPYWYASELQNQMSSDQEKSIGLELEIKLIKVISDEIKNVKIFDDLVSLEPPLMCGSKVNTKIKISTFEGKTVFQDSLSFTIGDKSYPPIFSYSLFNKPAQATRTVIVEAASLIGAQWNNNSLNAKILPPNSLVLIEFYP